MSLNRKQDRAVLASPTVPKRPSKSGLALGLPRRLTRTLTYILSTSLLIDFLILLTDLERLQALLSHATVVSASAFAAAALLRCLPAHL